MIINIKHFTPSQPQASQHNETQIHQSTQESLIHWFNRSHLAQDGWVGVMLNQLGKEKRTGRVPGRRRSL